MVGCQPWALEVVGSNPAGPIYRILYIIVKSTTNKYNKKNIYTLLPLRPPGFLVVSWGTGVTSSILPIRNPALAKALIAA